MAIDVTAVVTEHGACFRDGGQGIQDITSKFFQPLVSEQYFTVVPTNKTRIDKSHASISRVLQRFQKAFTAISTTTFAPDKCDLGHLKIDVSEYPDDIEDDWHGFLADKKLSRAQWPFVQYWLQTLVLGQEFEDYELNEFYKGEEGTITPGTATAAGRSINGIRWQLNNRSGVNTLTMGALPTDPELLYDYVIDMVAQIPRLHRNKMDRLFMNEDVRDLFREGNRLSNFPNTDGIEDARLDKIKDTSMVVTGLPSMVGDDKIFAIMPELRRTYAKKPENPNFFKVEEAKREVAAMTDYYRQPFFWFPQYAYMNDLETTTLYP